MTSGGDQRPALGRRGEEEARALLERQGYRILDSRFRLRLGEIDLVAEDDGTIVFVEVKTRRSRSCGAPEESVTAAKQRRLVRLASAYLAARGLHGRACRFDVVAIDEDGGGRLTARHLRDAFRA